MSERWILPQARKTWGVGQNSDFWPGGGKHRAPKNTKTITEHTSTVQESDDTFFNFSTYFFTLENFSTVIMPVLFFSAQKILYFM
jgi:hypothetical protein